MPDEDDSQDGSHQSDPDVRVSEAPSRTNVFHDTSTTTAGEATIDTDINASLNQPQATMEAERREVGKAILSEDVDGPSVGLGEKDNDSEGATSEGEALPDSGNTAPSLTVTIAAQAEAEKDKADDVPSTKDAAKNRRASQKDIPPIERELVRQIAVLLGQNEHYLFDDGWSRANIGLGRPVLRSSRPTGKAAGRYVPYSLNDEELFLAKEWTPLNISKAKQLIRRLSK